VTQDFSRVTLPPLWTLAQAKVHLTDAAYDADVQQKLDAAQEAIESYLNLASDPSWDATTAPKVVKHAIFLLLTYYYEDRTGAETNSPWPAIYENLAAYRDPTVV
jgi:hypothetical protein